MTQSPWSDNLKVFGATVKLQDRRFGTLTAHHESVDRHTGFTFDSTPVLVSFDVPVPAETLEPRNASAQLELKCALRATCNSPVNFVAGVLPRA